MNAVNQCRHVKFKGIMPLWPAQNQTHRTAKKAIVKPLIWVYGAQKHKTKPLKSIWHYSRIKNCQFSYFMFSVSIATNKVNILKDLFVWHKDSKIHKRNLYVLQCVIEIWYRLK